MNKLNNLIERLDLTNDNGTIQFLESTVDMNDEEVFVSMFYMDNEQEMHTCYSSELGDYTHVQKVSTQTFIEMMNDYNCFDDYFDEFHSDLMCDDELHAAITMQ